MECCVMSGDELRGIELQAIIGSEDSRDHGSVGSLDATRLAELMARVLHNEPPFTHMIPDERDRARVLSWFFQSVAIPACARQGEIYTNTTVDAAALWIRPGQPATFKPVLLSGMPPINLDALTVRRCMNVAAHLETVRYQLVAGPHWYLLSLGVEHTKDLNAFGPQLLRPVLSRADLDRWPCYLETFLERDLPFYKRLGFRIEGAGKISEDGPPFWAMIRPQRLELPRHD